MNVATLGFMLSLFGGVLFGVYMVPRKASKLDNNSFLWILGISVAISSTLVRLAFGERALKDPSDILLSTGCGVLWFIGTIGYSQAVRLIGLTRSTPIKNLGPILVTIYGIGIFKEFVINKPLPLAEAVLGSLLMTMSAIIFGQTAAGEVPDNSAAFDPKRPAKERTRLFRIGILWSLLAAFCYSGYTVPQKLIFHHMRTQAWFDYQISPMSFLSGMGLGVGIAAVIYYAIAHPKILVPRVTSRREWMLASLTGLAWVGAAAAASKAMSYISMSVSVPASNLSTLITVAFGIWVYREIHIERHRAGILLGLLASAVGVVLLSLATGHGKV